MTEVIDSDCQQKTVFLPHSGNTEDSVLLRRQALDTVMYNSKGSWKTRATKERNIEDSNPLEMKDLSYHSW